MGAPKAPFSRRKEKVVALRSCTTSRCPFRVDGGDFLPSRLSHARRDGKQRVLRPVVARRRGDQRGAVGVARGGEEARHVAVLHHPPAEEHCTFWQILATTPRSCVTKRSAVPWRACISR